MILVMTYLPIVLSFLPNRGPIKKEGAVVVLDRFIGLID
jgi:hypothetical protein